MGSTLTGFVCVFLVIQTAGSANNPLCSSNNEVAAAVGGTAVLFCHLETYGKNLDMVKWFRTDGAKETLVYLLDTNSQLMNQSTVYMGRTMISDQWLTNGEVTLKVLNITENDAGQYSCWTSPGSSLFENKCCSMKLNVVQNGKWRQIIIAWTLYLLSLALCLYVSYRAGLQIKLQMKCNAEKEARKKEIATCGRKLITV